MPPKPIFTGLAYPLHRFTPNLHTHVELSHCDLCTITCASHLADLHQGLHACYVGLHTVLGLHTLHNSLYTVSGIHCLLYIGLHILQHRFMHWFATFYAPSGFYIPICIGFCANLVYTPFSNGLRIHLHCFTLQFVTVYTLFGFYAPILVFYTSTL
ncbi:hypothetical protein BJ165DRAFT_657781 [Panaeolus papilionaceus]|nr:hypothetical protein BJ165DRAFT_657781 [Panaeolus papilionaceus]